MGENEKPGNEPLVWMACLTAQNLEGSSESQRLTRWLQLAGFSVCKAQQRCNEIGNGKHLWGWENTGVPWSSSFLHLVL